MYANCLYFLTFHSPLNSLQSNFCPQALAISLKQPSPKSPGLLSCQNYFSALISLKLTPTNYGLAEVCRTTLSWLFLFPRLFSNFSKRLPVLLAPPLQLSLLEESHVSLPYIPSMLMILKSVSSEPHTLISNCLLGFSTLLYYRNLRHSKAKSSPHHLPNHVSPFLNSVSLPRSGICRHPHKKLDTLLNIILPSHPGNHQVTLMVPHLLLG